MSLFGPAATTHRGAPVVDVDIYGDDVIDDAPAVYRRIRDAGPVVWLPRHRMFAVGRFDDVRAVLRDDATFRSGQGVAANPVANALGRYTTLSSDDDAHMTRRMILMHSLTSRAIRRSLPTFESEAVSTVERLLDRPDFDGVADFATRLPVQAVAQLVGLEVTAEQMLTWGRATFNGLGPANGRAVRSMGDSLGLLGYTLKVGRRHVRPDGWGSTILDAADRGEVGRLEAKNMIIDLVAPSLDTTILSTGQLLWSLGTNPAAWQQLRDDPELVPAAVVEAVRLASPVRSFTRRVASPTHIGGVSLRPGDRVAVLFAAANSDERQFHHPEQFSLLRNGGHVGWGHGIHTCVGMQLAKLEMHTLLRAMIPRVTTITVGQPERLRNNCLQGFESFRAAFR
ncbi:cytochrome P450 [Mycolicibacterium sp. 018/SC-01/001]|uniref:cytochrome P450 n=1 Tax=Mycolicibacterium sp. 018/SC-01/001 TaxID=2592069 RepID=UPI002103A2EE|nr:cytochrome P450 [Mycolicibacterium sp. 018/SC-01/001]